MSRNLCETVCAFCAGEVKLVEAPRAITITDAERYFEEFEGMIVAHAECVDCHGKYLAWVNESNRLHHPRYIGPDDHSSFHDLSYRSTFNDEPELEDFYTVDPRVAVGQRLMQQATELLDSAANNEPLRDHPVYGSDEKTRERLEHRARVDRAIQRGIEEIQTAVKGIHDA